MVSQKHCSEPKNGFGGENGGWCIGDALRATPAVSQNREQKPFLDVKGEKRCSSSGAIAGAKIWLLNSDKPNLVKYS